MSSELVITIDGPAGAGKSSVAKRLAKQLKIRYLDTGALYRAVAFSLHRSGIPPEESVHLRVALKGLSVRLSEEGVFLGDENVSLPIRSPEVDGIVSSYSALKSVRDALLGLQREQAGYGPLVVEGRDVGSIVFPDAPLKFFMTASHKARALRRFLELQRRGEEVGFDEVLEKIIERDRIDSSREIAPLKAPEGAVFIDTSEMNEDEVVEKLISFVQSSVKGCG